MKVDLKLSCMESREQVRQVRANGNAFYGIEFVSNAKDISRYSLLLSCPGTLKASLMEIF